VHDLSGLFREQVSMARRLVGTDKLPELNVRAIDMAKELDRVFERYANFFVLNGLAGNNRTAEDETLRATVLRQYIGDAAMDTIRPTAANKTYEELRDALIAKYKPAYSETHVRSQFFRCTMTEGQTSRDFLLQCWQAIRRTSCADENEQLQWVLTCFITRHSNEEVRRAFDIKAPATEAEALRMADEVESKQRERMATQKINAVLQDTATPQQSAEVHTVNFRNKNKSAGPSSRPFGQGSSRPSGGGGAPCNSCGGSEKCREGRCPGQRATCYECGKRGHLGRVCRQRLARQRGSPKPQSTNECDTAGSGYAERREHQQHRHDAASAARYQESGYEPSFQPADELYTFRDVQRQQMDYLHELSARAGQGGTVQRVPKCGGRRGVDEIEFQPSGVSTDEVSVPCTERKKTHDVWFEPIEINHRRAYVKIDTGAKVNVMSRRHFLELGLSPRLLRESRVVLVSFSQQLVQPIGCFTELVTINGRQIPMQFQVVTSCANVLISYQDSVRAGLVPSSDIGGGKSSCGVNALSTYRNEILRLTLKPDAVPKNFPPRKVPLALDEEVKQELKRMENEGVITPVREPTDWCSPMIVRRKPNGLLRVCMDPRYLNSFLKRATYPLPDIEAVFPKFRGAKYFSKMDMTMGFWQILLDEESSYMCTFSTPYGRYRYLRLPFGISPAPEVFHRIVADVIQDMPGVMHFVDDVLVWGNTKEEHDERLKEVLRRFEASGFVFNPTKCEFGKTEVMFLGHLVDGTRVRPNPQKVAAVKEFPTPQCADDVRRLLGVATYISKFIPRFSAKTAVLRRLLRADMAFEWTPEHEEALRLIQDELTSDKVLFIFDPNLPVQIATDASGTGLGAVLMQKGRPVLFAARSLTPAEVNYSIIEKELLAVVFALRRFHFYTLGRPVEILTDHQPLLGAAKNALLRENPRLDRLFDQIIGYDLKWTYVPGRTNFLPDYLSRLPVGTVQPLPVDLVMQEDVPVARGRVYNEIVKASLTDAVVEFARECIRSGWPRSSTEYPSEMRFLRRTAEQLRIADGVLVDLQGRVYVPTAARALVLRELHLGHPGTATTLRRAHELFFWPTMNNDTNEYCARCETCARCAPRPASAPLLPRPMPRVPGQVIAADFFEFNRKQYVAFYDVFSQFPFLWPVASTSAAALINGCRVFFQFSGCPQQLWCDQGSAFDSYEFRDFAEELGISIKYSSAEYPQSNGSAESAVKVLKHLKKCVQTDNELFRAILYLQNTVKRAHTASPAQIFLGRNARTPMGHAVRPSPVSWEQHFQDRVTDQRRMKTAYDTPGKIEHDALFPGARVVVHNVRGKSQEASIIEATKDPRTYLVEFDNGARSIRNRRFLTLLPRWQSAPDLRAPGSPARAVNVADAARAVHVVHVKREERRSQFRRP
jgi:transposase InsO family protein